MIDYIKDMLYVSSIESFEFTNTEQVVVFNLSDTKIREQKYLKLTYQPPLRILDIELLDKGMKTIDAKKFLIKSDSMFKNRVRTTLEGYRRFGIMTYEKDKDCLFKATIVQTVIEAHKVSETRGTSFNYKVAYNTTYNKIIISKNDILLALIENKNKISTPSKDIVFSNTNNLYDAIRMMLDYVFEDDFVLERLPELEQVQIARSTISQDSILQVRKILNLDISRLIKLQGVRNSIVKICANKQDECIRGNNREGYELYTKIMTAVTSVLDVVIHQREQEQ